MVYYLYFCFMLREKFQLKHPDYLVKQLLLKLSEKDEAAWAVASTVATNFDKLPDDVRNELLLNPFNINSVRKNVAETIQIYSIKIPIPLRINILTRFKYQGRRIITSDNSL